MNARNEIEKLSDEELLGESKKAKSMLIISCVLIGFLVGISIFSTFKNGVGFFTFFPIFFVFLIVNNQKNNKAIAEEIKSRKLN